jgi:hypothetical protein
MRTLCPKWAYNIHYDTLIKQGGLGGKGDKKIVKKILFLVKKTSWAM